MQDKLDQPVLVLEDDVSFVKNGLYYVNDAINILPNNWDVLLLGYEDPVLETDSCTSKWCRPKYFRKGHAYIIRNSTSILKMVQYENLPDPSNMDEIWLVSDEIFMIAFRGYITHWLNICYYYSYFPFHHNV